jgi:hypothetical protein
VLAGCAPGRLVRIIERAHHALGVENSMKAPQKAEQAARAPRDRHARPGSSGRAVSGRDLMAVEV